MSNFHSGGGSPIDIWNLKISNLKLQIPNLDINDRFILDYSKDLPTFYGLTSVVLAVILGISAAVIRKFFSNWNKRRIEKLKAS